MRVSGQCHICGDHMESDRLLDHLRVLHPAEYGDGPLRWPDGALVIVAEVD